MDNIKNTDMTKPSFEDAMSSLEDMVRRLEGGGIGLDESIKLYSEAIRLAKICNDRLDSAEQRVRQLAEGADGSMTDVPFIGRDNEA